MKVGTALGPCVQATILIWKKLAQPFLSLSLGIIHILTDDGKVLDNS